MNYEQRRRPVRMQPPMTPMIDCTFNLLIFFLLAPSIVLNEAFLTTNLPQQGAGPPPGVLPVRIRVELTEAGPNGEDVTITLERTQSLGSNFELLRAALEDMRARGVAPDTPVLIAPTMGCRHKWVVKAFDAAVGARFSEIHFAVPYE
jgi:biopolymer transport protein ExbD